MIAITKSWPLFTIFIFIFAFSFSFIGSEFQSVVITIPQSWIQSWYFAITFSFIISESRSLVNTIPKSLKKSWYLVILHFFFRPLWKSAVFRAGNVVGVGCHIFPLRLQMAFSHTWDLGGAQWGHLVQLHLIWSQNQNHTKYYEFPGIVFKFTFFSKLGQNPQKSCQNICKSVPKSTF